MKRSIEWWLVDYLHKDFFNAGYPIVNIVWMQVNLGPSNSKPNLRRRRRCWWWRHHVARKWHRHLPENAIHFPIFRWKRRQGRLALARCGRWRHDSRVSYSTEHSLTAYKEVSQYGWPTVWLVRILLLLKHKQPNWNQSNRRSVMQRNFPLS